MQTTKLATGETLTFIPEGHQYFIDSDECIGTSELMRRYKIAKPINSYSAPYAERGTRIDVMTNYEDEGDLDVSTVDPSERGYLESWRRFKREHKVEIVSIQKLVGSVGYWLATTIDRVAYVDGVLTNCNVKTGKYYKENRIQLCLEWLLHPVAKGIMAVYIDSCGSYEIETFDYDNEAMDTARVIAVANGAAYAAARKFLSTRTKRKKAEPAAKP